MTGNKIKTCIKLRRLVTAKRASSVSIPQLQSPYKLYFNDTSDQTEHLAILSALLSLSNEIEGLRVKNPFY